MLCVIKRINIISITIIFIISCLTITSYAATNEIDSITLDASDYNTSDALENNISKYLSNPDIEEVIVITENTPESYYDFPVKSTHSGVSPLTTSPVYYQIKNVVKKKDFTGSSDLAAVTGQPGITVSITKTKSVSTTLSATFGATYKSISGAVGWNVTGSTSISISGSAKVPKTHNGKSVKNMTLHAKSVYKVKRFDVYRYVPGYTGTKKGTGTTKKAYGVSFTKTYSYR